MIWLTLTRSAPACVTPIRKRDETMSNPRHYAVLRIALLAAFLVIPAWPAVTAAQAPAAKKGKIQTFEDILKRYGIKDAEQRKYIEDSVKKDLQEEITKHIDLTLDVEVYLKALDHLANGEVKEANTYLMEEVGKKVLEWAVGGTGAKVLIAAWDFDKYVWTSVQAWAEKQDQDAFHKWIRGRVNDWRHNKSTYEMLTDHGARTVFDLWWKENEDKQRFGKTKMYGDRQKYYTDFEAACRHRFMDVAAKHRQANEERENLKLAIRSKLFEIAMKISYQESRYKQAARAIRRAGLPAGGNAQAKRYWSDPVFRKKVDDLAVKNAKTSTLELEKKVLASADSDVATAGQAAELARKAQSEGRMAIVSPPLGRLSTFQADYQSILQLMFSNSVEPEEGLMALRNWQGRNMSFVVQLGGVRDAYRRMPTKNQAQRDQLNAEAARIEKAIKAHSEAIANIRKTYDAQALTAYNSLRGPEAKLQELQATKLHLPDYAKQAETLWEDAQKIPADEARKSLAIGLADGVKPGSDGLTPGARGLAANIQNSQYRADSTPHSAPYVINDSAEPKAAMNRLARWMDQVTAAYRARIDRNIREFTATHNADQAVMTNIKRALDEFESVYEGQAGAIVYASTFCKLDKPINCNLEGWRFFYMATDRDLNKSVEKAIVKRGRHHRILSNMYGFGTAMGLHFAQELEMLSRAEQLAADAAMLRAEYGKVKRTADDPPAEADDITKQAIAILRSGDQTAVFGQMMSRYQSVRGMLDGKRGGYERVLTPAVRASHGLDKAPFEGWRRPTVTNSRIIAAMDELIDKADTTNRDDSKYETARIRCVDILAEFTQLVRKPRLLNKQVGALYQQAEKDVLAVQGAIGKPKLIVHDVKQAEAVRDSFKTFAGQCAALQVADDRRVTDLLAKARSQIVGTGGTPAARNAAMQRAIEYIDLAELEARVLAIHPPYAGQYRHDKAIRDARAQLGGGVGAGDPAVVVQTDPTRFEKKGSFHVSLNGKVHEQVPGTVYPVASQSGELEIRASNCDPMFVDARKVMLRLWTGPTAPKDFVTVAEGKASFVHTTRIESGKTYVMELRIVMSDGVGYAPKTFPLSFQWAGQTTHTGGAKTTDDEPKTTTTTKAQQQAYQTYIAAYNKVTKLASKGNTPEGKQAYKAYAAAKKAYEDTLKTPIKTPLKAPAAGPGTSGNEPHVAGTTKVLAPSADSHVYAYAYRNWNKSNWGAYNIIQAGFHPTGGEKRAYLKFDLTGIDRRQVGKATLRLYHNYTQGTGLTLGIYRVLGEWIEGSGTYPGNANELAKPGELAWVAQPPFEKSPMASFNPGAKMNKYVEIDVTELVKQWLAGQPNHGMVIKAMGALGPRVPQSIYGFYSREHADKTMRPVLILQSAGQVDTPDHPGHKTADTGSGKTTASPAVPANSSHTGENTTPPATPQDSSKAYQTYIAAYNKMTKLMAAGKGNTPEGKQAYLDYAAAKKVYEDSLKTPATGSGTTDAGDENVSHTTTKTPPVTDSKQAYQTYIAAYNKLTKLIADGRSDTPEAKQAYRDYAAAKKTYEDSLKTP